MMRGPLASAVATLALLLSAEVTFAQRTPVPAPPQEPAFGAPLRCDAIKQASLLDISAVQLGVPATASDAQWVTAAMRSAGYPAVLPSEGPARAAALRMAALLRAGHIVAAKMVNDEAESRLTAFKGSAFASSFESLLTVLTQPVAHASYPTSVRADGEHRGTAPNPSAHTHGVDLEQASASLSEVIARVRVAQKAMGGAYAQRSVRYYLLAHGFRDLVALKFASAGVCALALDESTRRKLDVSARYMAMPSDRPAQEPGK